MENSIFAFCNYTINYIELIVRVCSPNPVYIDWNIKIKFHSKWMILTFIHINIIVIVNIYCWHKIQIKLRDTRRLLMKKIIEMRRVTTSTPSVCYFSLWSALDFHLIFCFFSLAEFKVEWHNFLVKIEVHNNRST